MLEQNYRSTASILKASLAIVSQDKNRIPKSLHTSHPPGATPLLRSFPAEHAEALFIAIEIKKLIAHMGGSLSWGDVAILLRFNALSRVIEGTLQKHGIPSRVLGGHKFFERQEVKNILAYLQLVDNPDFTPALVRSTNVPSRGIGDKTLQEIAARAERSKVSQLSIMEGICDGRLSDMRPAAKRKLLPFVSIIRTLRDLANKGTSPADLIRRLVDLVGFQDHLKKTQPDWESRWENVNELISFATEVAIDIALAEEQAGSSDAPKETPLRSFLQASMLSSEGDNQSEEESKDVRPFFSPHASLLIRYQKVTISTCHAAKGLEWPVVMIPSGFIISAEDGTFPFSRSEDEDEERRLLYVACTRAQGLLYITHAEERSIAGNKKGRAVSPFLSAVQRDNPVTDVVKFSERTTPHHLMDEFNERSIPSYPNINASAAPIDLTASFTSSSAMLRNTDTSTSSNSSSGRPTNPPSNSSRSLSGHFGVINRPFRDSAPSTSRFSTPDQGPSYLNISHCPQNSGSFGSPFAATASLSAQALQNTVVRLPSQGATTTPLHMTGTVTIPYSALGRSRSALEQPRARPRSNTITKEFAKPVKLQVHPLLRKEGTGPSQHDKNVPTHERLNPVSTVAPPPKLTPVIGTAPFYGTLPSQGTKRRLGMGRGGGGYANKKFKPPT
ncbi:hypothetical protein H0H87_005434 [Tephrocybe sp. NHM501043]|nr:hypothetical protein H0H87_005434 [Tephrocybe sp. NHM501043]